MATTAHVGKAGHLAVMAEFLLRGYNVAMPEVDLGDDIYAVEDQQGRLWRIQVKTALGQTMRNGWRAKFSVSVRQIDESRTPDLFFALAIRLPGRWEFLLMPRQQVEAEHVQGAGSVGGDKVLFTVRLIAQRAICSSREWQFWRNNWSEWPEITN